MTKNPLQQYFRQPKLFMAIPSNGAFTNPQCFHGDITNMPVYGMTGMDQILIKTPDALFTGDSTVKVIQSCCPYITDAWGLSNIDLDAVLVAIRIATFGNLVSITNTCKHCNHESDYEIDLTSVIDHFKTCKFNSSVVLKDLTIKIKPLTYKQASIFNIDNFIIQKKLAQSSTVSDEEQQEFISKCFEELAQLQNKIIATSISSIQTPDTLVEEYNFIQEWVSDANSPDIDIIKKHIEETSKVWKIPQNQVKCDNCGAVDTVTLELDLSTFFGPA